MKALRTHIKEGRRKQRQGTAAVVIPDSRPRLARQEEASTTHEPTPHLPWWKSMWKAEYTQDEIALALGLVAFAWIVLPCVLGLWIMLTSPN